MRSRGFLTLAVALVVGFAAIIGSFRLGAHMSSAALVRPTDDLEWLRLEFRLSEADLARVRQIHEGYLPICRGYCERIAVSKAQMIEALGVGTNVSPLVDQKLAEIGSLRAQCQAAMLRHFAEVSRAMPPAQGARYLAEMQRLALGAHERIESSMSPPAESHEHHHGQ